MGTSRTRCLIIGQDGVLTDGLRYLLEPIFEVALVAADTDAVLQIATEFRPHAAIICSDCDDSHLLADALGRAFPSIVVTLVPHDAASQVDAGRALGAEAVARLLQIARMTKGQSNGEQYDRRTTDAAPVDLSARQREVVALLARGWSMRMAACELGITPRAVAFHAHKAMQANCLRDRAQLLEFALRHGLSVLLAAPLLF